MLHLDTSFLVRALVRGSPEDRVLREKSQSGEKFGMSMIAWAEFLCGPVDAHQVELASIVVPERIPFGPEHASRAARLFNETGRRRGSFADCMIAATALYSQVPLATVNPDDFNRFEASGLVVLTA